MTGKTLHHVTTVGLLGVVLLFGTRPGPAQPRGVTGPPGYQYLGREGQTVVLPARSRVAYGARGKFVYRLLKGRVVINNGTFGDPTPGVPKHAFFRTAKQIINAGGVLPPDGYKLFGKEGETKNLRYYSMLAYGARGKFVYHGPIIGRVRISNGFFGGDPVPGVPKLAFYKSLRGHPHYEFLGAGPPGFKFLGIEGETKTLSARSHVAFGVNGKFHYAYNVQGPIHLGNAVFGDPASNSRKYGYYKTADATESTAELDRELSRVLAYLRGRNMSAFELGRIRRLVTNKMYLMGNRASSIRKAIEITRMYEQKHGALFMNEPTLPFFLRKPDRRDNRARERLIFQIQQGLHSAGLSPDSLRRYPELFRGLAFKTAEYFPGSVGETVQPSREHRVRIKATLKKAWGKPTAFSATPVRRPTGMYLPPGSIGEILVPGSMVNKGFSILVGGHTWNKTSKNELKRFDDVSKAFPITSARTRVANPFGGGIYVRIPPGADAGMVTIRARGLVRAPLFRMTSFDRMDAGDWRKQREFKAPWTDLETDKFMLHVPTHWINKHPDPREFLRKWDRAMDGVSELLGYPSPRNNVWLYLQVDTSIMHQQFGIGYPQAQQRFDPRRKGNGNEDHMFFRNILLKRAWTPPNVEFHELGHGSLMSYFHGHHESIVQLPFVYVAHVKFGLDLEQAMGRAMGYENRFHNLAETAKKWMVRLNFREGRPMDISNSTKNEVRYQVQGYARYVDIVKLFGWEPIRRFYRRESLDYMAGRRNNNLNSHDSRILRLSKAANRDLRPLLHFWGIHPQEPGRLATAIRNGNLRPSRRVYDRLRYYRSIVPRNRADFLRNYRTLYPEHGKGHPDYGPGWYRARLNRYTAEHGRRAMGAVDGIIAQYFPGGRPGP